MNATPVASSPSGTAAAASRFVGLDWGTTHRRAYALGTEGACTGRYEDDEGAIVCTGRFAAALDQALVALQVQPDAVLMSGMVGSAFGWKQTPYLSESVPLSELPRHLLRLEEPADHIARLIVPGYCVRDAWGQPDVMRGEETQLLGAWALGHHSGWFVLPGTHSKWVQLQAGRIVQLRTYMTGELFDLLGKHGTIAAAASDTKQAWDDVTLLQGVQAAQHGALGHQLFGCRARIACGDMPASHANAYLSGLLIGAELHDVLQSSQAVQTSAVHVIGTPALARHYQTAGEGLQLEFNVLDAQKVYLAALAYLQAQWKKS